MIDKLRIAIKKSSLDFNKNQNLEINLKKYDSMMIKFLENSKNHQENYMFKLSHQDILFINSYKYIVDYSIFSDDYIFLEFNPSNYHSQNEMMYQLNLFIWNVSKAKINRIDLAVDFIDLVPFDIYQNLNVERKRKMTVHYGSSGMQTIYIGKMPVMFRIYDKTVESYEKRKEILVDKIEFKKCNILRFEIQIRNLEKVTEKEMNLDNIFEYLNSNNIFSILNVEFIPLNQFDEFEKAYLSVFGCFGLKKYYRKNNNYSRHKHKFEPENLKNLTLYQNLKEDLNLWSKGLDFNCFGIIQEEVNFRADKKNLTILKCIQNRVYDEIFTLNGFEERLEVFEKKGIIEVNSFGDYILTEITLQILADKELLDESGNIKILDCSTNSNLNHVKQREQKSKEEIIANNFELIDKIIRGEK